MNNRIVIELEGGLVQNVYADDTRADCFVVDADTEGADPEDITTVEHEGQKVSAYIRCECAGSIVDSLPHGARLLLEHDFPEDPAFRKIVAANPSRCWPAHADPTFHRPQGRVTPFQRRPGDRAGGRRLPFRF